MRTIYGATSDVPNEYFRTNSNEFTGQNPYHPTASVWPQDPGLKNQSRFKIQLINPQLDRSIRDAIFWKFLHCNNSLLTYKIQWKLIRNLIISIQRKRIRKDWLQNVGHIGHALMCSAQVLSMVYHHRWEEMGSALDAIPEGRYEHHGT